MPRVKAFNEDEALGKALELFWEKGYEATSLSHLTNHLGIGKGSFYDTFGSKRELFTRAIARYRAFGLSTLDTILAEKEDVMEGIRYFLKTHTSMMMADESAKGCFIANSTTELSDDEEMQAFLEEHNRLMKARLEAYLRKGPFKKESDTVADMILQQATGISVLSKIIKDEARFNASNELLLELLAKRIG